MDRKATVLIVDDDPTHQQIYGWIIEASGYRPSMARVAFDDVQFPDEAASIVLLDYHLGSESSAVDIARLIHTRYPDDPIVILSDALALPEDVAPLVQGFVRKGDPAKLVDTVRRMVPNLP